MNIYFILLIVFLSLVYIGLFWGFPIIGLLKIGSSIKDGLKLVCLLHFCIFVAFLIAGITTFLLFKSGII